MKKSLLMVAFAMFNTMAFGKAVSTQWIPVDKTHRHRHGVGLRCPYCSETWTAIPRGLKAWETKHLLKVRRQAYDLHIRLRHGSKVALAGR